MIDGGDPRFPRPAPETVYVLWYPQTTEITRGGDTSCVAFAGYHEEGRLMDGTLLTYVVMPRCLFDAGATEVPNLTTYVTTPGLPWPTQRVWSNRSASLGNDPCVPGDVADFAYAAPLVADTRSTSFITGSPLTVPVVHIPVGTSATWTVKLMGAATSGISRIAAYDYAGILGQTPQLTFSTDNTILQPGGTAQLTITKVSGDATRGAGAFEISTTNVATNGGAWFWAVTSD
jgi:hypothetical protein